MEYLDCIPTVLIAIIALIGVRFAFGVIKTILKVIVIVMLIASVALGIW